MSEKYKSTGKIIYKDDGWIVLECHNSICNYYKGVIEKLIWKKLSTSYHGSHITILPAKHNGDFTKHVNWCKYANKTVEFEYSPIIYTNELAGSNRYFWLKVDCSIIGKIREEFGLDPKLKFPAHLTIGYLGY